MTDDVPRWGPPVGEEQQYGQQQYGQQQYGQQQPHGEQPHPQQSHLRPILPGPGGEPPIWAPWYGIGFVQAYGRSWRKYVRFDGRASRSEFWWVVLWNTAIGAVLTAIWGVGFALSGRETVATTSGVESVVTEPSALYLILGYIIPLWTLAILLPSIALAWRRLHDANLAGPFFFLGFVPFVGSIVLLVFALLESRPGGARFDRPEGIR